MYIKLIAIFQELNRQIPIEGKARHNLTYSGGNLTLTIFAKEKWYTFIVEEEEFEKAPIDFAKEVKGLLPE